MRRLPTTFLAIALVALGVRPAAALDPVTVTVTMASKAAAGACPKAAVAVNPPKPGTTVELQRLGEDGLTWATVASGTLDDVSQAVLRPCLTWSDIGTLTMRAHWPQQDPSNAEGLSPELTLRVVKANWMRTIDDLTAGKAISVSIGEASAFLYERRDTVARTPASNEKLLLSMALLNAFGPDHHITTRAATTAAPDASGVVYGDLWILGRGDPEITRGRLKTLAKRLSAAGVTRIAGRVFGSTAYFKRDWWAPGWKWYFPRDYIALPTALTFERNSVNGVHVNDPERRAAAWLTKQLEGLGIAVKGKPGMGVPPGGITELASIASPPLDALLRDMNVDSVNFLAEVLGKHLGAFTAGSPGSIPKGAGAIRDFANASGVPLVAYDSSGLSYDDAVTARGVVRLLWVAEAAPWGENLRVSLPTGGQGTLEDRLHAFAGLVRAKTGTLTARSALSGWVWSDRLGAWVEFSILSRGMSKSTAAEIEDAIVRITARSAH